MSTKYKLQIFLKHSELFIKSFTCMEKCVFSCHCKTRRKSLFVAELVWCQLWFGFWCLGHRQASGNKYKKNHMIHFHDIKLSFFVGHFYVRARQLQILTRPIIFILFLFFCIWCPRKSVTHKFSFCFGHQEACYYCPGPSW